MVPTAKRCGSDQLDIICMKMSICNILSNSAGSDAWEPVSSAAGSNTSREDASSASYTPRDKDVGFTLRVECTPHRLEADGTLVMGDPGTGETGVDCPGVGFPVRRVPSHSVTLILSVLLQPPTTNLQPSLQASSKQVQRCRY